MKLPDISRKHTCKDIAMKILLINPPQKGVYGKMSPPSFPPIGLAYIAANLEANNYEVNIIDVDAEKLSEPEIIAKIRNYSPDIIGITSTTPTFNKALKMAELIKKNIQSKIVLGGIHVTIFPRDFPEEDVDFLIRGEGEITFLELVKTIETGNNDFSNISGLSYKKDGQIIHNENRKLIENLDTLPFPAWHLFKRNNYSYPDTLRVPVLPIMTSRGCPGKCIYCCTKSIFGHRFRARSAKNIIDEIEKNIHEYNVKEIHIWDDCFTANKRRVFEFCSELKKRDLDLTFAFPNGLRVDYVNEEILSALKEVGVYSVAFGVESGNQLVLDSIKKEITLIQVENAVAICKKLKLETWCFFLIGVPIDTKKTIEETIQFSIYLDPDIAKFHLLKPFPGTEVYQQLLQCKLLLSYNYDDYGIHTKPVHRLSEVNEDELIQMQKMAYRRFYLRPSKILNQIRRLKSTNRIKQNLLAAISILRMM